MPKKSSKKATSQRNRERALLEKVHLNAAGIDVGADAHWVAVPEDRDPHSVRRFGVFSSDLVLLCHWLKQCQIETIVMESTGVYWIVLFQLPAARCRSPTQPRAPSGIRRSAPFVATRLGAHQSNRRLPLGHIADPRSR